MNLADAIKLLKKEYERAKTMCFVRNPLAWALYRVWKKADGQKDWDEDCIRDCRNCWRTKQKTDVVAVETNIYDKEEIFPDCTVQVLTNTATGEVSVGWWKNELPEV